MKKVYEIHLLRRQIKIIKVYNKCKSPAFIKEKYGVSKSTLYVWKK